MSRLVVRDLPPRLAVRPSAVGRTAAHSTMALLTDMARRGAEVSSRALLWTIVPADHTLGGVVRALRAPATGEARWTVSIASASARYDEPVTAWGRFLYRLVREVVPDRCVQFDAGISTSYLAAGLYANYQGHLTTIERSEESATAARAVVGEVAVDERVEIRSGPAFDPSAVLHELGTVDLALVGGRHRHESTVRHFEAIVEATAPGGLLVFEDIAERAWNDIRADARITGSITVGTSGLAVVQGARSRHRRVPRLTIPA